MSSASRTSEQNLGITSALANSSIGHRRRWLNFSSQTRWSIYALLAALCLYRLAVFRPVPLDAPGTLRPILYALFHWFLGRSGTLEEAFAQWSTLCSLALFIPAALAILYYGWQHALIKLPPRAAQVLCSRWLFFASITVCLVLCRYPTLLQEELNPDEGAFIAAAFKLFYDPNFFHAADCATNGPLNIYPLMLPALFGFSPDFASSRALAIVIVVLCAFLFQRAVALLAPEELARFAVLPFVGAMAVFKDTELRHYSSEYVPLLLIAITLYFSVRVLRQPAKYPVPVFLLGLLPCAAFFAKMQSVPIVLSLAVVALAYVYASGHAGTRGRPVLLLVAGAIPLPLLNVILCVSAGVWKDFWISYIQANISYASGGTAGFITNLRPFLEFVVGPYEVRFFLFTVLAVAVAYLVERMRRHGEAERRDLLLVQLTAISAIVAAQVALPSLDGWTIYTYLVLVALCMLPLYFVVLYSSKSLSLNPTGWFGFLALISNVAAFYSIYKAHRPFRHYLLFLFLPLCAVMAWMLIQQAGPRAEDSEERPAFGRSPRGVAFIALVLALTLAYQSFIWSFHDDEWFKAAAAWIRPGEGEFVRSITSPGPTVFVWGWNVRPYLGSGRVTATRDVMVDSCFRPYGPPTRESQKINNYYKKRVVHDLRANPPELFIDAVSVASWFINNRRDFGFEQVPELNQFVKANYVAFTERYEPGIRGGQGLERYYLRRDLAAQWGSVRLPRACASGALACFAMPAGTTFDEAAFAAHKLPAIQMPAHALIEAQFTPVGVQTDVGTVFNNEAVSGSFRGFRFQSIGGDRYRLILGLGQSWAFSKSVLLPPGKPASVSIEFNGTDVYIRCNGVAVDDLHLAARLADTPGPVTMGSWIDGQCRFSGAIQFFQVLDLGKAKTVKS